MKFHFVPTNTVQENVSHKNHWPPDNCVILLKVIHILLLINHHLPVLIIRMVGAIQMKM